MIAAGSSIGLTIPDAVRTVLCPRWWAEEPPETCREIYRNKRIEKTLHLVGCTLQISSIYLNNFMTWCSGREILPSCFYSNSNDMGARLLCISTSRSSLGCLAVPNVRYYLVESTVCLRSITFYKLLLLSQMPTFQIIYFCNKYMYKIRLCPITTRCSPLEGIWN